MNTKDFISIINIFTPKHTPIGNRYPIQTFLQDSEYFRNFAIRDGELTMHSEMKRKTGFPFSFLSFFRNFAGSNKPCI